MDDKILNYRRLFRFIINLVLQPLQFYTVNKWVLVAVYDKQIFLYTRYIALRFMRMNDINNKGMVK